MKWVYYLNYPCGTVRFDITAELDADDWLEWNLEAHAGQSVIDYLKKRIKGPQLVPPPVEESSAVKVAKVYSIAGEHTIYVNDREVSRASDDEACVYGSNGEFLCMHSALVLTGRFEAELKRMGVTHCIDLADPVDGPQEDPVPIAEFFRRWRTHLITTM